MLAVFRRGRVSEGPEIRRLAIRLNRAVRNTELVRLDSRLKKARAWLDEHPGAFEGARFLGVESCGKHLIFRLDRERWMHFHLLMYGKFTVHRASTVLPYDPNERALLVTPRVQLRLIRGQVLDLGIGDPNRALPSLARIGPDVLAEPFDEAEFRARLLAPGRQDQQIAVALLDQDLANGVGNYLKSEILFKAELDPWRPIGSLTPSEVARLTESMLAVCRRAFEADGWTIPDALGSRGNLNPSSPRTVGRRHWVFRRTKYPCLRCGTPIRAARQGSPPSRMTFFCALCQHVEDRPVRGRQPVGIVDRLTAPLHAGKQALRATEALEDVPPSRLSQSLLYT
jgi:endonuclease-8